MLPNSPTLDALFTHIPLIERVHLRSHHILQCLALSGMPDVLVTHLIHLTQLDLCVNLGDKKCVKVVICLLESSPNLMSLEIQAEAYDQETGSIAYLETLKQCGLEHECLKTMKIDGMISFIDGKMSFKYAEHNMFELLCMLAPNLQKIEVKIPSMTEKKALKPLKRMKRRISRMSESLSKAKLIFCYDLFCWYPI